MIAIQLPAAVTHQRDAWCLTGCADNVLPFWSRRSSPAAACVRECEVNRRYRRNWQARRLAQFLAVHNGSPRDVSYKNPFRLIVPHCGNSAMYWSLFGDPLRKGSVRLRIKQNAIRTPIFRLEQTTVEQMQWWTEALHPMPEQPGHTRSENR